MDIGCWRARTPYKETQDSGERNVSYPSIEKWTSSNIGISIKDEEIYGGYFSTLTAFMTLDGKTWMWSKFFEVTLLEFMGNIVNNMPHDDGHPSHLCVGFSFPLEWTIFPHARRLILGPHDKIRGFVLGAFMFGVNFPTMSPRKLNRPSAEAQIPQHC